MQKAMKPKRILGFFFSLLLLFHVVLPNAHAALTAESASYMGKILLTDEAGTPLDDIPNGRFLAHSAAPNVTAYGLLAGYDASGQMTLLARTSSDGSGIHTASANNAGGKTVQLKLFWLDDESHTPLEEAILFPAPYEDPELARAVTLGLGQCKASDNAVTYAEFAEMLHTVILLSCEENTDEWESAFRKGYQSDRAMTRREGMVAVYLAAEVMGPEYYRYNNEENGAQIFDEIASVDAWQFWNEMWDCDYSLFPDVEAATLNGEASYINAGYFYSMNRASHFSGETVFTYDSDAKSMRPADPFTYTEALLSAVRLYDSYQEIKPRPMTAEDQKILADADALRAAILDSETAITVTGTSYYVSADGDDRNDGKSEVNPWATLEKVNTANLQPGDAVFFRRGDIWRGEALIAQNGVTYSAYGEGSKPGIYGSPEDGASPEKWSLLPGTENIWVFYRDIMDCGDIVLDGSMDTADKAPVWWTGSQYVKNEFDDTHEELLAKPAFDPARDMENLQFFNDIDYRDLGAQYPLYVYEHAARKGTLYLRCDEGNPGEVYKSIEFCCDPYNGSVVTLNFGISSVLDNLAVLYGGHGIEANGGKAVQNCEVGYMGAMTHTFYDTATVYSGDGIIHTLNMTVENNYVHHVFNSGIAAGELSFAADGSYADTVDIQGNNTIRNNLLEYTAGITLLNWEPEVNELHMFKDITIEGNYVMYSTTAGDPSCEKAADVLGALVFTGKSTPTPCANENLVIRNNVFYCSQDALIISGMPEEYYPVYSGNIYAQYPNAPFAYWRFRDGTFRPIRANEWTDIESFVRNELGDESGTVL